jgi:hypothetical protein
MLLYSVEYSQLLFLMIAICIKQPVSITSGAKKYILMVMVTVSSWRE